MHGRRLHDFSCCWDNAALTPEVEASTLTTKGLEWNKSSAEVKPTFPRGTGAKVELTDLRDRLRSWRQRQEILLTRRSWRP